MAIERQQFRFNECHKFINLCFEFGIFPDFLKIAQITPILKQGCKLCELSPFLTQQNI